MRTEELFDSIWPTSPGPLNPDRGLCVKMSQNRTLEFQKWLKMSDSFFLGEVQNCKK